MLLDISVFRQYPIVQVCILGIRSLYYTFIWFVPCLYSAYACTCTAVGWWKCRFSNSKGATIGANLLDHLFLLLLFCFVRLWFSFSFLFVCLCRILVAQSLFTCEVGFFRFGHCIAFPSINGFGLPLWYLQTFLIPIMSFYSNIIKFINKHYTVSRSIHSINN